MNVTKALLKAILELIEKCETLEELRERVRRIMEDAFWTKGTVEFRLFNGTTHAGKIKAYIQFCLGMSQWAINAPDGKLFFRNVSDYTPEQKKAIMTRMLVRRFGLSGDEFKTCRLHLTSAFTTAA